MTADFRPGNTIGKYVLDDYIGGGSFGTVWRGHDAATGQQVAVKLLTGALSSSETAAIRAEIELLAASAASRSEHVVNVVGGGASPVPHIVMEYVEGRDLSNILRENGKLTPTQTIEVGLAIADALAALSEVGIIHRDIKPANVMLASDGVIKLTDFGIAKIVGYETMTMAGQTAMTMAYAPPEIWDDGSPFGKPSHKSDLYAMGVLLFECLAGEPPFRGNYGALYRAHLERTPDVGNLPPDTPPSLRTLISRCLEKKQEDRPRDAAECISLLRRAEVELAEATGDAQTTEPKKLGPWIKDAPHESVPWAWHCHHETRGGNATVEVHFVDTLDYGARLRKAVAASSTLTPLGAERVIDSNRLLLHPSEAWHEPPPGRFQFWVAREDLDIQPAAVIDRRLLRVAVPALAALIAAAETQGVEVEPDDNLTIAANGSIYLRRPGIAAVKTSPAQGAVEALLGLPLDADARALVTSAPDFNALTSAVATVDPAEDATRFVGQDSNSTVVVGRPPDDVPSNPAVPPVVPTPPPAPSIAPVSEHAPPVSARAAPAAAGVSLVLRRTSAEATRGEYELTLQNQTSEPVELRLEASDDAGSLGYTLPRFVTLPASASQVVPLRVAALRPRKFGLKRKTSFTVAASGGGSGGSGQPPFTIDGEFEEQPPAWPMFAGAGVFGVAIVGILAVLLLGGGGNNDKNAVGPLTATATASATTTASATAVVSVTNVGVELKPTSSPVATATATQLAETPANRMNCDQIRGTAYLSPEEGAWYRANCSNTTPPTSTAVPIGGGGVITANTPTPVPPTPTPVPPTATVAGPTYTVVGWGISSPSGLCQGGPVCTPNATAADGGQLQDCGSSIYLWIKLHNVSVPAQLQTTLYFPDGHSTSYQPYNETDSEHTYWVRYTASGQIPSGTWRHELRVNGVLVSSASVTVYC